jgi:hypothetical protein
MPQMPSSAFYAHGEDTYYRDFDGALYVVTHPLCFIPIDSIPEDVYQLVNPWEEFMRPSGRSYASEA